MKTLYFASANRGKTLEMQSLLEGCAVVRDLLHLQIPVTWEETGASFQENALIKVRELAALRKGNFFADDSGLCVEALHDAPGIYSARWAGLKATDESNNQKLLQELSAFPKEGRKARFVCVVAYKNEKGEEFLFEGQLSGTILSQARGSGGFGYDPLFMPEASDKTLAELSLFEKNKISHRSQAVLKLREFLSRFH